MDEETPNELTVHLSHRHKLVYFTLMKPKQVPGDILT